MNHTLFSMQHILNEPLDPNICKRILQQIKSPLMQQSFAMTNDQSLSNSYMNAPKRPNIPPPTQNQYQYRRPAIKNKYNTFANGQSFYDESKLINNYGFYTQNKNFLGQITNRYESHFMNNNRNNDQNYAQSRIQIQSVVSPLDPNITQKKIQEPDFVTDIWNHFCGNTYQSIQQKQHQINYEQTKSKFQRKKIFDSRGQTILQGARPNKYTKNQVESILLINQNQQKSHISLQHSENQNITQKAIPEAVQQLRRNNHFQIAQFIQIMAKVIDLLKIAEIERIFLLENIQMVYQLTSFQNNKSQSYLTESQNFDKFFSRMKCSSISDLIRKISQNKLIQAHKSDFKQYNKQRNKVSQSLEKMLSSFSQIQSIMEQFLKRSDSIEILQTIHTVLNQKFTKSTTKNSFQQILNLFHDVRLYQYEKQAFHLEYIWDLLKEKILSQNEFINDFTKTNGRYQKEKSLLDSNGFEVQLSKMGFVKN